VKEYGMSWHKQASAAWQMHLYNPQLVQLQFLAVINAVYDRYKYNAEVANF
jgi:hypothetical protein